MQIEQKCIECGETFMRSLYHPQITKCSKCKSGGGVEGKSCVYCVHSHKFMWWLRCSINDKDVTLCKGCRSFKEGHFTQMVKDELDNLAMKSAEVSHGIDRTN